MKIKGLTLIRPWGYAVIRLDKDIENRTWKPGANQLTVGDWIAIHNGLKWSQVDADDIAATFGVNVPPKAEHPESAIIGVVQYMGYTTHSHSDWFFGPYGWLLSNPIAIEPVPHGGARGLWTLEPAALAQVEKAVGGRQ